jgi:hypothetical protein
MSDKILNNSNMLLLVSTRRDLDCFAWDNVNHE